jgi:hypothetical protein
LLFNNRVIFSNNGVLTDLSKSLSNYFSLSEIIDIVALQDYIYIGSDLPFNHRWFEITTANDQASVISAHYWDGSNTWRAVKDIVDSTIGSTGKTLSQSGEIAWTPDRYYPWGRQESTEDMTSSGLTSLAIYDMFWLRLSFSADLKGTTSLKYLGHCFSNDEALIAEYPDLSSTTLMTAHTAGKTSWKDQHFIAAKYILEDLRKLNIIWSNNQVLDSLQLQSASVHRTAAIIYDSFGDDYADNYKKSMQKYKDCMTVGAFRIDQNGNARLDSKEKKSSIEFMDR